VFPDGKPGATFPGNTLRPISVRAILVWHRIGAAVADDFLGDTALSFLLTGV